MEVENVGSSSGLILRECDNNPNQQFVFEDDGKIKPVNDLGLCLTASGDYIEREVVEALFTLIRDLSMSACENPLSDQTKLGF